MFVEQFVQVQSLQDELDGRRSLGVADLGRFERIRILEQDPLAFGALRVILCVGRHRPGHLNVCQSKEKLKPVFPSRLIEIMEETKGYS